MSKETPMMKQYLEIKKSHPNDFLFYRLGDFYEMFFDDAITASKELEITLTGRECGLDERAPMCGVPHHSSQVYINRLTKKGYKVAICEQVEDAKEAKGIVKRDVIRVVTPGTNLNTESLDATKNNYLACIIQVNNTIGFSASDITTGDFYTTQVNNDHKLLDEIAKFSPSEIIYKCNENCSYIDKIKDYYSITMNELEEWYIDKERCQQKLKDHFKIHTLEGLGLIDMEIGTIASGALLQYLYETQKNSLHNLITITPYLTDEYMLIDSSTRRNLELVETLREKNRKGSLIWILDKTKTAMGARLLRTWIEQPLIDSTMINKRLNSISEYKENTILREELREVLGSIYDLERLMGKISYGTANPRDLIAFKKSLKMLPYIKELLKNCNTNLNENINEQIDELTDVYQLIEESILDEPPISVKEGNIIKDNFNQEVDKYRKATTQGKQWIAELEEKEKVQTGIKTLKIKYNKIFGYYIDVTKSYLNLVPQHYTRKQTLANSERYIIQELKDMEETIIGAEEKVIECEYKLFIEIKEKIGQEVTRIKKTAKAIATLDVLLSLAFVAERNQYIKPKINTQGVIDIKEGRHPVVEKMMQNDLFIFNDTYLNNNDFRMSIITGPNMAGKSTYMRQVALIVLMAQIGSFVPAAEANICIVDRIFTRVGASDDLAKGQSTFMVEMTEVANILRNSTKNSLLILDEIGRGTSTFDGLSIAWSVVEYISNSQIIGAKTLFATHYHELTELEGKIEGVNNYCIAVKEQGDDIIFLRKIIKGGADQSYGIQVAKLAGVPQPVIDRAKILVSELSESDITKHVNITSVLKNTIEKEDCKKNQANKNKTKDVQETQQLNLFNDNIYDPIIQELKTINVIEMTPLDALNKLYQLQKQAKE